MALSVRPGRDCGTGVRGVERIEEEKMRVIPEGWIACAVVHVCTMVTVIRHRIGSVEVVRRAQEGNYITPKNSAEFEVTDTLAISAHLLPSLAWQSRIVMSSSSVNGSFRTSGLS